MARACALLVLVCGVAVADHRNDSSKLEIAQRVLVAIAHPDDDSLQMFGSRLELRILPFPGGDCAKRFGTPRTLPAEDDRKALLACLAARHPVAAEIVHGLPLIRFEDGVEVLLGIEDDERIAVLGGNALWFRSCRHAKELDRFRPSGPVAAKIAARAADAEAAVETCIDATGHPGAPRVFGTSAVPSYDREVLAAVGKLAFAPLALDGKAVAACELLAVTTHPDGSVEPTSCDRDAPPPLQVVPPQNVPSTMLEMIAGDQSIAPDDATREEIAASGKPRVIGSFKLCLDAAGSVVEVDLLRSTGHAYYDRTIESAMQRWKFKPYTVNGKPIPVCTAETLVYPR